MFWGPYNAPERYFDKERSKAQLLCDFYETLSLHGTAEIFCKEKKRLQKTGLVIEDFDLLIASTALANDLILVTDNNDHFSRIEGLQIENWKY